MIAANIWQHESVIRPGPARPAALLALLAVIIVIAGGCSCSNVPSVRVAKEYLVELVTETGETIVEKAGRLAEALKLLWRKVFPNWEGKVKVDPLDPLRGRFRGTYHLEIVIRSEDGREDKIRMILTDPTMCRESADDPFEIDPSNYPAEVRAELEE